MKNSKRLNILFLKICITVMLVLLCVFSVSCGSDAAPADNDNEPETVVDPQETSEEDPNDAEPETVYLPIRVTGDLHDGIVYERGAKTSKGYYEIMRWQEDMMPEGHGHIYYGNILYTDYETCRRVYLCNVPGCAHNNPDCTSFVKFSTDARLFTDYSETHLYFMSTGLQDSNITEEDLASITEMDMDGSNRRLVCTLSSGESIYDSAIEIASDRYVYTTVVHTDYSGGGPSLKKEIQRIWFEDGRREKVYSLNSSKEISEGLLSVWGNQDFLINQHVYGDDSDRATYRCRVSQSGEFIERVIRVGTFTYYSDRFVITGEETDKKATVTAIDYATGEQKTIYDVPAETNMIGQIFIYYREGSKLNWTFLDENGEDKTYMLDFAEGTYKINTLKQRNTYEEMPIAIVADAGDSYLVITGGRYGSVTLTDAEGITHIYPLRGYPEYALISKDDYWNCIPNYRYIEDTVC